MEEIIKFIESGKDSLYLDEPDRKKREIIHQFVKDNFVKYISRTEYMSHGLERNCCDKWHRSSKYGKSWNGGFIFCDICNEITYLDFDDCDDVNDENYRLSNYKPTSTVLICKKGVPYKKSYKSPFSYRKHYKK